MVLLVLTTLLKAWADFRNVRAGVCCANLSGLFILLTERHPVDVL